MATKLVQMRYPEELLDRLDAKRGDRTRTDFVIEAVEAALAWKPKPKAEVFTFEFRHPKAKRKNLGYLTVCGDCGERL